MEVQLLDDLQIEEEIEKRLQALGDLTPEEISELQKEDADPFNLYLLHPLPLQVHIINDEEILQEQERTFIELIQSSASRMEKIESKMEKQLEDLEEIRKIPIFIGNKTITEILPQNAESGIGAISEFKKIFETNHENDNISFSKSIITEELNLRTESEEKESKIEKERIKQQEEKIFEEKRKKELIIEENQRKYQESLEEIRRKKEEFIKLQEQIEQEKREREELRRREEEEREETERQLLFKLQKMEEMRLNKEEEYKNKQQEEMQNLHVRLNFLYF